MGFWVEKVIDELRWKSSWKYDIDNIMGMIDKMKHPECPMEAIPEADVVEIEVVEEAPEESEEFWKPEDAKLPETSEDTSSDKEEEKSESDEEPAAEEECSTESEWCLESPTPVEQDRMDEILKAIKTIYPNEKTEDVLVRMVSKLIWL